MQNRTLMNQNSELSILIKAFFHQDIALYFDNAEEYLTFFTYLKEHDIVFRNPDEFPLNKDSYDPRYPYYYVENKKERIINSNSNIKTRKIYHNLPIQVVHFSEIITQKESLEEER